jgi:hypothetical protein
MISKSRSIHYSDNLEESVAMALDYADIKFVHESENKPQRLDFYLPEHNVYIEVKKFHADRISEQMATQNNVVAVQGSAAVDFINKLLHGYE